MPHAAPPTIESMYRQVARRIPRTDTRNILLSATNLPRPPGRITVPDLVIKKGETSHEEATFDFIRFSATKRGYRNLGLVALAALFQPTAPDIHLSLTHPSS